MGNLGSKMLICWNTSVSCMKTSIDNGCATPPPPEVLCVLCVVLRALQNEDSAPEGFFQLWGEAFGMVWVPKSGQTSSKIGPLALSSALGRPSAAFGTTLGGIWGPWGSKKSPMGTLRAPFGRPVGSFGRLGGPFWLPLECFGRLLGSFMEARGFLWGPRRRKRRLFGIMRFP